MKKQNTPSGFRCWAVATYVALAALALVNDAQAESHAQDLTQLSMEDLMDVEVTSVSKREQTVGASATAIFVLTEDDIHRSTAQSIPELLRMVPGLHVARLDSSRWAIGARGHNGLFSDKLLVLVDGRTIYNQFFSGIFWDSQDLMLEDIERIEVIRGPGASVWGANAVVGVINITTKNTKSTNGFLASGGAGNSERGFGSVRYGADFGDYGSARIFARSFTRENSRRLGGGDAFDDQELTHGGFRMDWDAPTWDLTTQGDLYASHPHGEWLRTTTMIPYSEVVSDTGSNHGGNILTRATKRFDDGSSGKIQFYFDRIVRDDALASARVNTFDLDSDYHFKKFGAHLFSIGLSSRIGQDAVGHGGIAEFDPERRTVRSGGGFFQDEIAVNEKAALTLGAKVEHNEYTGVEIQPTARIMWESSSHQSIWAAVSRSVRTPNRVDEDLRFPLTAGPTPGMPNIPSVKEIFGNRESLAEQFWSYEVGYRQEFSRDVSFDATTYYTHGDRGSTIYGGTPTVNSHNGMSFLEVPLFQGNAAVSDSFGVETVLNWQPCAWWRLQGWYAFNQFSTSDSSDLPNETVNDVKGNYPRNQFALRSLMDLSRKVQLDAFLRYVDTISAVDVSPYTELDVRLAWKVTPSLELSLNGVNLLDDHHQEYRSEFVRLAPTEFGRSYFAKATFKF